MSEYWTEFVRESEENITELNTALLDLERDPGDEEAIDRIFRTAHTLKGNCGAMGLEAASDLAHAIEELLSEVRAGRYEVTSAFMDDIFEAVDRLEGMIDDADERGEIEIDPAPTIEVLRSRIENVDDGPADDGIDPPTDEEVDEVLERVGPPADDDHETYFVRLSIDERDRPADAINGDLVVEALVDAFDLLGTDPPRERIADGEYDGRFDAVFGSAVGEAAIASALEPVAAVDEFEIAVVTDRLPEPATDDAGADAIPDVESTADVSPDEAQDLGVDELLAEFDEFDDLDALVEELDDDELEPFEDMGDAGSFDDLLAGHEGADDGASAVVPGSGAVDSSASPAEAEVDDAGAVFEELKREVEMVDFDELQDELAELEFDEFEDEVEMEELIGDDAVDDGAFLDDEGPDGVRADVGPADEPPAEEFVDEPAAEASTSPEEEPSTVAPDAPDDGTVGADAGDVSFDDAIDFGADFENEVDAFEPDNGTFDEPVEGVEGVFDDEPDVFAPDVADEGFESDAGFEGDDAFDAGGAEDEFDTSSAGDVFESDLEGEAFEAPADDPVDADGAADEFVDEDDAVVELEDAVDEEDAVEDIEPVGEEGETVAEPVDEVDAVDEESNVDVADVAVDEDDGVGESDEDGSLTVDVDDSAFVFAPDVEDGGSDDGGADDRAAFEDDVGSDEAGESSAGAADVEGSDDELDSAVEANVDDLGFEETDDSFEDAFGADVFDSSSDERDAFDADVSFDDATIDDATFDDASTGAESDEAGVERVVDEPELGMPDVTIPERADRSALGSDVEGMGSVRVDVEQIDALATLVEGLVTSRVRLRDAIESGADRAVIDRELDDLDDLTADLQDTVMEVRLVPLQRVASRLPRVVRDIAREQDKKATFELSGGDVELDRSVLDRIRDPLIHLVRNAVDHGIEPPGERETAGKPREGTVTVRAGRSRDRVTITVEDDGRGIDPDRLRASAVEAGVVDRTEADELSDEAAIELIFHPGLSTVEEVTDVSGRGVGMDVVERTVEELDGSVSIDSTRGSGTAVTMTLPVTVAIADVLFVESGEEEFGVPLKAVRDIDSSEVVELIDGDEFVVTSGNDALPVISLAETFDTSSRIENGDGMVVRVRDEIRPVAIRCDRVRDQQEVVVNPFEGFMADIPGVSGATVRGRGEVVPILDVTTL